MEEDSGLEEGGRERERERERERNKEGRGKRPFVYICIIAISFSITRLPRGTRLGGKVHLHIEQYRMRISWIRVQRSHHFHIRKYRGIVWAAAVSQPGS